MAIRLSFGIGPVRVSAPVTTGKKKPRKGPPPYMTHDGCSHRHPTLNLISRCAAKKGLPAVTQWAPHQ